MISIRVIAFISIFLSSLNLNAQHMFGQFPLETNDQEPLATSELLKTLDWESLKKYSNIREGHHTYIRKDSLKVEYEYVQKGLVASFKVVSFKGKVLEFNSQITDHSKPSNTSYFDKNVWMEYVGAYLPRLPDSLGLEIEEPEHILKAYYHLLGVDTRDEYGWICEYSTVGMAPGRRQAVIALRDRPDLLKKVLHYPNIQTQLYAADALIYHDYEIKHMIQQQKEGLKEHDSQSIKDFLKYLRSQRLDETTWQQIYNLRDSKQAVRICGNSGSYKIYESNTSELLSEETITDIPEEYNTLKELGYFTD